MRKAIPRSPEFERPRSGTPGAGSAAVGPVSAEPVGTVCAAAQPVAVDLPITLGQFVKLAGFAATGGEAKCMVIEELVRVNGRIETRRGHKLALGDVVEVGGAAAEVIARLPSLAKTCVPAGEPGARARMATAGAATDQQPS